MQQGFCFFLLMSYEFYFSVRFLSGCLDMNPTQNQQEVKTRLKNFIHAIIELLC